MHPEEQNPPISESSADLFPRLRLPNERGEDDSQQSKNIDFANTKTITPTQGELWFPTTNKEKLTISESQGKTRGELAIFLVRILYWTIKFSFGLFIGLVILSIFIDEKKSTSFDKTSSLVKESITVIFTAQISIVATAIGFYFGLFWV